MFFVACALANALIKHVVCILYVCVICLYKVPIRSTTLMYRWNKSWRENRFPEPRGINLPLNCDNRKIWILKRWKPREDLIPWFDLANVMESIDMNIKFSLNNSLFPLFLVEFHLTKKHKQGSKIYTSFYTFKMRKPCWKSYKL